MYYLDNKFVLGKQQICTTLHNKNVEKVHNKNV